MTTKLPKNNPLLFILTDDESEYINNEWKTVKGGDAVTEFTIYEKYNDDGKLIFNLEYIAVSGSEFDASVDIGEYKSIETAMLAAEKFNTTLKEIYRMQYEE